MGYLDLQYLVARLDKAERRLLTQRTDPTSEYARMLSALMQNPEITEDALKRKLGYDAKNRKYYDTRSYLYNFIVEQLTSIWDSKGELSATPNAVRQAQTLLRKGLPEACIEHIHKALPKAAEDENLVARIELLQLEYEASVLVSGFWGQEVLLLTVVVIQVANCWVLIHSL